MIKEKNEILFFAISLLKSLIVLSIWATWKVIYRKERYHMKENEISVREREIIAKHEKAMKEEYAKEQVNRMEQERIANERRATEQREKEEKERQERLRKEKEKKKAEQNKKFSVAGQGNDIVTNCIGIVEDGVKMLYSDTKYIIRMSIELLQKRAEKNQLTEKECNKIVQTYENLKYNVEQLDKVNKNLKTQKDKKVVEKYENSRQSLEKKVCETLDIKKDKPKLLRGKKAVETSFQEKVYKGLSELKMKADIAKSRLSELKVEKEVLSTHRDNKSISIRRTTNNIGTRTVAKKTRTR